MELFDKVGSMLDDTNRLMSGKMKNLSKVSNLKSKIAYEEERIYEIWAEMGKTFYLDPERSAENLLKYCADIDARRIRIKKMTYELKSLKGKKFCASCGFDVDDMCQFCSRCGKKILSPEDNDFGLPSASHHKGDK